MGLCFCSKSVGGGGIKCKSEKLKIKLENENIYSPVRATVSFPVAQPLIHTLKK